ncbi:uncharacterized protein LOC123547978 [Mercenaria mercenaria]|uniref:uncharacterized protein LOC123547978 n=1 Tax=Mercenaria mercenaria TaxID=6596 RepID=UPI00234F38E1|nr:uncharacterized protein LOC123547978 [Mercenaria mercenaria]XP_045191160.2 uncharacterized protein LOC123547978 [Mercenaria mercenaria]
MASYKRKQPKQKSFAQHARDLDSSIDDVLVDECMVLLAFIARLLQNNIFINEEFIPVGSCTDGSKVNLPGDFGDIDILVIPNHIILNESDFEYDRNYPAFLRIRINKCNEKYFKYITQFMNGKYLPNSVLKDIPERLFPILKLLLIVETWPQETKYWEEYILPRSSSVGQEHSRIYPEEFDLLDHLPPRSDRLKQEEKRFMKNVLIHGVNKGMQYLFKIRRAQNKSCWKCSDNFGHQPGEGLSDGSAKFQYKWSDECVNDELNYHVSTENSVPIFRKSYHMNERYGYKQKTIEESKTFEESVHAIHPKSTKAGVRMSNTENEPHQEEMKNEKFSRMASKDFVPAFKFKGWPRTAEEWIYRPRKWPSKLIIRKILDTGFQVVAKRPRPLYIANECSGKQDPYFRLSFALSEQILANDMKKPQKVCWRVLKAYQKGFLQTKTKILTSYHWKNALLWVSEQLDASFWTDQTVLECVLKALEFVEACLKSKQFPFYFVRNMNLLAGFHGSDLDELQIKIQQIRQHPLIHLRNFIEIPPSPEPFTFSDKEYHNAMTDDLIARRYVSSIAETVDIILDQSLNCCDTCHSSERQTDQNMHPRRIVYALMHTISNLTHDKDEDEALPKTFVTAMEEFAFQKEVNSLHPTYAN